MFTSTKRLAIVLLVMAPAVVAADQLFGNPTLRVPVSHAPGLGLQVQKVVFAEGTGEGAVEFAEQLMARFVSQNVQVLERSEMNALLREQNFSLSGAVDRTSAATLGKILGPTVMVFINMQRYTTDQTRVFNDWKDRQGVVHRTYISRTRAYVRVSIRSVDLATGRIFAAKVLESTPVRENKIDDKGWPEYPDAYDVLDSALRSVVTQASRLYLPWESIQEITFFDDGDCNLKSAYNMLKTGDKAGAMRLSLQNVDTCRALMKPNPKALSHAYYNVGTLHFLMNNYEAALRYLRDAQSTRADKKNVETIEVVSMAAREAAAMQAVEDRMTVETAAAAMTQQAAAAAEADATMTNAAVVSLVSAQVPAALIVAKIKSSSCRFDTTADGIIALKKAAVPDDVVIAMMGCK